MSEDHCLRLVAHPAFHQEQVLREILVAAADSGLWTDLAPLLRALPAPAFAQVPRLVDEAGLGAELDAARVGR